MKVNYAVRPAKCIERKMIAEALWELSPVLKPRACRYIGFGSATFTDFSLFHRQLGICDMISIEKDTRNSKRYDFNRPYGCIQMKFGDSGKVLPRLDWSRRSIVWLDYECCLDADVLGDIECVVANLLPASFLLVTLNVGRGEPLKDPVGELRSRVGDDKLPVGLELSDFQGWRRADVECRIAKNIILDTLRDRNGASLPKNRLSFIQALNFRYQDNARMATVGGLIVRDSDVPSVDQSGLAKLDFFRADGESYFIDVPLLTYREIRHLDQSLPGKRAKGSAQGMLSQEEVEKYERIYRYYPVFTEAEL